MHNLINEISELVYVADPETYELLYLNETGKKKFGVEEYQHQKCYKILQHRDTPCEFCTNSALTEEGVYSWEYFNPVAKRNYVLKDKFIRWNGRIARMEVALDVTEQVRQRVELMRKLEMEKLIVDCVKILHQPMALSQAVDCILEKIGIYLQADRTYIFMISDDTMSNTYEWCRAGVEPQKENLQGLPVSLIDRWQYFFKQDEYVRIEDMETIKDQYPIEYQALSAQQIHNLIAGPLKINGRLLGYIGVDNPALPLWTQIQSVLEPLSYFLVSAIDKIRTDAILESYSYFDTLTGLNNRNRFIRNLDKFDVVGQSPIGVVYLDVNGLKNINDREGHSKGDEILVQLGEILQSVFSEDDCYRIGSDEFVVLCHSVQRRRLEEKIQELKNQMLLTLNCTAAIGYRWSEQGSDIHRMVTEADELMYEDKKNYYRANPPTSRYRHNVDDALGLADLDTLRRAVAEKRFEVYLQPKVSFQDRSLRGAEALVRYRNQDGSIEVPDQFIPALEEARLIYYLDFYMFNFVCREIRTWLEQGYRVVPVAVNFSRYTFLERNYVEKLLDIWKKYDIPQSLLEIEITESVGNVDSDYLLKIINDIRAAGFAVAIDDFGVKYANLSLFKSVDIDTLKLDRSMIGQLTESRKSRILIQSLSQICKSMHTQLVVEGVETEEQFFILRELGCDCAQGFLFGKPMPVEQYVSWLSEHRSKD